MAGRISRRWHKKVCSARCAGTTSGITWPSPANTCRRSLDSARFDTFDKQDMKLAEALSPLAQCHPDLAEAWPRKSAVRRLAQSVCLVAAALCCFYTSGILDTWTSCPEDHKRPRLVSYHKLVQILNSSSGCIKQKQVYSFSSALLSKRPVCYEGSSIQICILPFCNQFSECL